MHEFSICQALVAEVLKELKKHSLPRTRLKNVLVAAGEYHRFVPQSLKFAYRILTKDTPAKGSSLRIRSIPIKIKCANCGWEGRVKNIALLCKKCGGTDVVIIDGKELFLESIEVESEKGTKQARQQKH